MSTLSTATALFGETQGRVLAAFFTSPGRSRHVRDVVRAVGTGSGQVQRELAHLAASGLLVRERVGNQVRYRANEAHPVYADLRGLILKTVGLAEPLRIALEPLRDKITVAFVFGSMAAARDVAASDVDVLVIGQPSLFQLVGALGAARDVVGREITPVAYTEREFKQRVQARHPFLLRVLSEPKIFLVGDEHDLAGLVGKPLAGAAGADAGSGRSPARTRRAARAGRGGRRAQR